PSQVGCLRRQRRLPSALTPPTPLLRKARNLSFPPPSSLTGRRHAPTMGRRPEMERSSGPNGYDSAWPKQARRTVKTVSDTFRRQEFFAPSSCYFVHTTSAAAP